MAYVPKIFVDHSVEFPNRRKLTAVSGQANTFDVTRAEGTVFAEGTKPDAASLNTEFGHVKTELDTINNNLTANSNPFIFAYDSASASYGYKAGGADTFHPFKSAIVNGNIGYTAVTALTVSIPAGVKEIYVACTQSMSGGTFYGFTPSGTPYVSISNAYAKQTMNLYPYYSQISIQKITLNGTAGTLTLTPTGGTAGSSFNLVYNYFY